MKNSFQIEKLVLTPGLAIVIILAAFYMVIIKGVSICTGAKNEFVISYKLTDSDLTQLEKSLETESEMFTQLLELQGKTYETRKEFEKALKSITGTAKYQELSRSIKIPDKSTIYKLTDQSLKRLKSENIPEDIITKIQDLKDMEYRDKTVLEIAARNKIAGLKKKYPVSIIEEAAQETFWKLGPHTFIELKEKDVPQGIIDGLVNINRKDYQNIEELQGEVKDTVESVIDKFMQYPTSIVEGTENRYDYRLITPTFKKSSENFKNGEHEKSNEIENSAEKLADANIKRYLPIITKHAESIIAHRLTARSLKELEDENIPEELLEKLQKLKSSWFFDKNYFDKNKFETEVKKIIAEMAGDYGFMVSIDTRKSKKFTLSESYFDKLRKSDIPDVLIGKLLAIKSVAYSDENELKNDLKEISDDLKKQNMMMIMGYAEKLTNFKLDAQSIKSITSNDLPDGVIKKLLQLKGETYSSKNELENAVSKIVNSATYGFDHYPPLIAGHAEVQESFSPAKQYSKEIEKELKNEKIPESIMAKLGEMKDIDFPNKELLEKALDAKFDTLPKKSKTLILEQARKEHQFDEAMKIQWSGGSCGCVLDDLSGVVYGFYPFWLAEGVPQEMDFSVLSRIGYFALLFDDNGTIGNTFHWGRGGETDFRKIAHRYRTKVDLIVYSKDWDKWCRYIGGKYGTKKEIDELTTRIVDLVRDKRNPVVDVVEFLLTPQRTFIGDGVTVYTHGYPADDDSVGIFNDLVSQLNEKLGKSGEKHSLNIMLTEDAIGSGVYNYGNLERIIKEIDLFLVFLTDPIHVSVEELRQKTEKILGPKMQRKFLRKIVPVIIPSGYEKSAIEDLLVYIEDNFGGVGLWPVPIGKTNGGEKVNVSVKNEFTKTDEHVDVLKGILSKHFPWLCKFICPNRWVFRIIWDILIGISLVYALLSLWICELRVLYRKYFWYFLAAILLIILFTFLIFVCNLFWKNRESTLLIILVLAVLFETIRRYVSRVKQSKISMIGISVHRCSWLREIRLFLHVFSNYISC